MSGGENSSPRKAKVPNITYSLVGFSKVKLGIHEETGEHVALKILKSSAFNEVAVHKVVQHLGKVWGGGLGLVVDSGVVVIVDGSPQHYQNTTALLWTRGYPLISTLHAAARSGDHDAGAAPQRAPAAAR